MRLRPLTLALLFLLGGCGTDASRETNLTATPSPPAANLLAKQLCGSDFCWVAPLPQGNTLRAVSSTAGTSYAVGDHGTFLRFRSDAWTAATIPALAEGGAPPNLTSVWAPKADVAWIAGRGGALLRYDGATFQRMALPGRTDAPDFVAVTGTTDENVWAVERIGAVDHFDGAHWTTPFRLGAPAVGAWVAPDGQIWVLGQSSTKTVLAHFDGAAWSEEVVPAAPDGITDPRAAIAIGGDSQGRPWLAFQFLVTVRDDSGAFRVVYKADNRAGSLQSPLTSMWVTPADGAYLASGADFGSSAVTRIDASGASKQGFTTSNGDGLVGTYLGSGPGDTPWVLGAGGEVRDVGAPEAPVRTIVPQRGSCARVGDGAVCAVKTAALDRYELWRFDAKGTAKTLVDTVSGLTGEPTVYGDANGRFVVRDPSALYVRGPGGNRTLPLPEAAQVPTLDVVLDEAGPIYVLRQGCRLERAKVDDSALVRIDFALTGNQKTMGGCALHHPATGAVFVTSDYYVNPDAPEAQRIMVHRGDGVFRSEITMPKGRYLLAEALAVSKSERLFAAFHDPQATPPRQVFERVGSSWQALDVPVASTPMLAMQGEDLAVVSEGAGEEDRGATLHLFRGE
ncbi:MAG: hypothetical protein HOO96_21930, partial [Polyangiaceae bacterium]|nr:hypothetical protein [Polyangiaceae bacterium]